MLTQYFVGFCLWVLMRRTRGRELVVNYIKQLLDRDENMLQHSAPDTFWRKGFASGSVTFLLKHYALDKFISTASFNL